MRHLKTIIYLMLLLPFLQASGQAAGFVQDSSSAPLHAFSEGQWKRATRDMDYSQDKPEEKSRSNFLDNIHLPFSANVARIIIYAIIIGLLLFILIKVFSGSRFIRNKKVRANN